jgi:hypothetical protein
MKIFKNNVWIDTSIYDSWPDFLNDCWIGIEYISSEHTNSAYLINNKNFVSRTLNVIDYVPDEQDYIAVIQWGIVHDDILMVGVEVKEDYRNMGVATFFGRYIWTWLMENNDRIVRLPAEFRSDPVEKAFSKRIIEKNVDFGVVRTINNEYKKLEEVDDLSEIWVVSEGGVENE